MGQRPDQSIILSYQECKFCGSSDGFVFYDSHGYCYHCSEVWFGQDYDRALEDMHRMHWTFRDDKTRVPQPDEYFGFVYIITNKKTQRNKRGLHYYEQYYQMKYHVLTAVLEGTDQREYYNKNVGGIRFYVPLERWEDPEWKRKADGLKLKGPYKITFDTGKEITIDNLKKDIIGVERVTNDMG